MLHFIRWYKSSFPLTQLKRSPELALCGQLEVIFISVSVGIQHAVIDRYSFLRHLL